MKKITGLLHVTSAYLVTLGAAWATLQALGESPIWDMFWADIAATIAIFVFSRLYKNSSFYDAFWSAEYKDGNGGSNIRPEHIPNRALT